MQVQLQVMASNSEAIALPQGRRVEPAESRRGGRQRPATKPTLISSREDVLRGFKWENTVWVAVAASALALLAASLIG
jgi:hypothetical protein